MNCKKTLPLIKKIDFLGLGLPPVIVYSSSSSMFTPIPFLFFIAMAKLLMLTFSLYIFHLHRRKNRITDPLKYSMQGTIRGSVRNRLHSDYKREPLLLALPLDKKREPITKFISVAPDFLISFMRSIILLQ